jgi:hypothetical protein
MQHELGKVDTDGTLLTQDTDTGEKALKKIEGTTSDEMVTNFINWMKEHPIATP